MQSDKKKSNIEFLCLVELVEFEIIVFGLVYLERPELKNPFS